MPLSPEQFQCRHQECLAKGNMESMHASCDQQTLYMSDKPVFINIQLLSSCCCACKKYRPSVHNAALVWVTIAVPVKFSALIN